MPKDKKEERKMDEPSDRGWEPKSAAEIKEILDAVGKTIPDLLKSVTDNLYGPEAAKKYAQAVAQFYKELRGAGMSDEQAFQMTREYMARFSMGGMLGDLGIMGGGPRHRKDVRIVIDKGEEKSDEKEE